MIIHNFNIYPYTTTLTNGQHRQGCLIHINDQQKSGWGDMSPLPGWSKETYAAALKQLKNIKTEIMIIDWQAESCLEELAKLSLLPSVSFAVESALLSLLVPITESNVPASALLMGTTQEILEQAQQRQREGYTSAKLKVGNLSFEEAAECIHQLKSIFFLRIDVNRAWTTSDSLNFFSQFRLDSFDYVEEPFKNPQDLNLFPHSLAIDESYPTDLSLAELEALPSLKAVVYKPTIQGGILGCLTLLEWTKKNHIQLILSSSFESSIGLASIVSMAQRLGLHHHPIGIGTHHFISRLGDH